MADSHEIRSPSLLLVEGPSDAALIVALSAGAGMPGVADPAKWDDGKHRFQIVEMGGKTKLRQVLQAVRLSADKIGGLRSLGVLQDANGNAQAALQSVTHALRDGGLEPPKRHGEFTDAEPAVGVFIAPDGCAPGALEGLCRQSVEERPEARCVDELVRCVETERSPKWIPARRAKAWTYAYLAVLPDPECRLDVGARQGHWRLDSPAFRKLAEFLRRLADSDGERMS